MIDMPPTPLTDALCTAISDSSAADAAGMGTEIPCEEAYGAMVEHARKLEIALAESVKLQSHYAELLNVYDGGQRMTFISGESWLSRLTEVTNDSTIACEAIGGDKATPANTRNSRISGRIPPDDMTNDPKPLG